MKTYQQNFRSITELARYISDNEGSENTHRSSKSSRASKEWSMSINYDEALTMARNGGHWPAGAEQLQSVSIQNAASTLADMIAPEIINDVTGGAVDIGAYLSDDPECFLRVDDEQEQVRPLVRIAVELAVAGRIPAVDAMNRGRAVLAMVEALELQGYSTELVGTFITYQGHIRYECHTVCKQAGEPWNPSAVAFMLAHPAFSRRLGFRMVELHDEARFMSESSYGNGSQNISSLNGFNLYVPYLCMGDLCDTPAKALKYIERVAREQAPDLIAKH